MIYPHPQNFQTFAVKVSREIRFYTIEEGAGQFCNTAQIKVRSSSSVMNTTPYNLEDVLPREIATDR
jgi:hypothetical protein